jgi:hypothetical protein
MRRSCLRLEFGTLQEGDRTSERGPQDGRLTITSAEKYAKVCREGAVLGTGRCSLMNVTSRKYSRDCLLERKQPQAAKESIFKPSKISPI